MAIERPRDSGCLRRYECHNAALQQSSERTGRCRPRREVYSADSGKRQGLRTRSEQLHRVRTAPELAAETHQAEFALWRALQRADRLAGQLQSRATLNRLWPV